MKKLLKLTFFLYLFILSIELIKKTSLALAPDIKLFLMQNLSPIKAVAVGWFTTSIVQSSGAVGSVMATFIGNNLITLPTTVYILIGASFGTSITALIISFITESKQKKDFRHGFEIGLCYAIYSALLVAIIFPLEFFFQFFSKTSLFLASQLGEKISFIKVPNIIEIITSPVINPITKQNHNLTIIILAFIILLIALRYLSKSIIEVFGGEDNARKFINKYFDSKYKAYIIGIILTAIVFSSSITIGLLVPLAVSRLISLKKAIPFILGADLGTFTDLILVSLIIGKTSSLAVALTVMLFGIIGGIIFLPHIDFLHKITKYTSKKLIKISRKKAFYILLGFIAIPLAIILIF
ncbi:Na/Pi cotransporter family protein [archaeon]|jgi:solute carrier family 34 (sodium-dependent phosphate cotransporter)|nr:Na/Pi cotransporter family protein [archaeon]